MKNLILILIGLFALLYNQDLVGQNIKGILSDAEKKINKVKSKRISPDKRTEAINDAFNLYIEGFHIDTNMTFTESAKLNITILKDTILKIAANQYNKENYKNAFQNFEKAYLLATMPQITTDTAFNTDFMALHAGLSAFHCKAYAASEKYLLQCVERKYKEGLPYERLSALYNAMGYESKAIEILNKGILAYPNSPEIIVGMVNHYLLTAKFDSASVYLERAIAQKPDNPTYYFARGAINEQKNNTNSGENHENIETITASEQKPIEDYKKAIELKPDYFDAYYNLGTFYFNKAVYIYKEADKIPVSKAKEYQLMVEKAKMFLNEALPYFEKAYALNKEDSYTQEALKVIYKRLGMKEQEKEFK